MADNVSTNNEVTLETAEMSINEALDACKAALKNDVSAYEEAKANLEKCLTSWNALERVARYTEFKESNDPLMAAIKTFYVTSKRLKEIREKETNILKTVEVVDNAATRIDIAHFVEWAGLNKDWLGDCDRLLQLLQLRKTDIYTLSPKEISAASYFFMNAVKAKANGGTPDSNTQLTKLLQKIVDATIGSGYKVTVRDIAFVEDCAHQFDAKAKCGIKSMKSRGFQTVMASVLYHLVSDEAYQVKNAKIKGIED